MYLIIIADVLCGVAPAYDGLLTNLVGVHGPGGARAWQRWRAQPLPVGGAWPVGSELGAGLCRTPACLPACCPAAASRLPAPPPFLCARSAAVWYVSRPFVLAAVCATILAPLLSLRDLGRLGPMSTAGVAIAGGFAASVVGVTAAAVAQGQLGGARAEAGGSDACLLAAWRLLCRRCTCL